MAFNDLSEEQHYFTCFTIVCVDIIKLPLKDILTLYVEPADLYDIMKYSSLVNENKLSSDQLSTCYVLPPGLPDYNKFDATLLYILIRHLCPLLEPTRGWGNEPLITDILIGDDIERLRLFRENFYAYADSCSISISEFAGLWENIRSILQRLQKFDTSNECVDIYENKLMRILKHSFLHRDMKKYRSLLEMSLNPSKTTVEQGKSMKMSCNCFLVEMKYIITI